MSWYERYIFNPVLDWGMDRPAFHDLRKRLLSDVSGRILELGLGTGLNLPHYPSRVKRITSLTLDSAISDRAQRRADAHQMVVEHEQGDGRRFPFDDATFDSIVCTITLCSVRDPVAVIAEMERVLCQDGRLFVWEHVLGRTPMRRGVQHLVNPYQRFCGCGCTLTRDTRRSLEQGGFAFDWIDECRCDQMPWPARDIIVGVAHRRLV